MIFDTFGGCLLDVMIVVTPAPVAISAAMIFVSMPPVPRLEPRVVVLTKPSLEAEMEAMMKGLTLRSDSSYRGDNLYLLR
jgi:hypothetical protein